MSLPQYIKYGIGGTIYADLDYRTTGSVLVDLYDGRGYAIASNIPATVSPISTTIQVAANAGFRELNVANLANISAGQVLSLTDDQESVLVYRVDSPLAYLRRPLLVDHVANAELVCTRLSCVINSDVANMKFYDGQAEFRIGTTDVAHIPIECGIYPMKRVATAVDLEDEEPSIYAMLEAEEDIERLLDRAHQYVLAQIALISPDMRARAYPGSQNFINATILAALSLVYRRRDKESFDRYRDETKREIETICQILPRDSDQDRIPGRNERVSPATIVLSR